MPNLVNHAQAISPMPMQTCTLAQLVPSYLDGEEGGPWLGKANSDLSAASHYIFNLASSAAAGAINAEGGGFFMYIRLTFPHIRRRRRRRRIVTIKAEAEHNNWLLLHFPGRQRPLLIPNSRNLLQTSNIWAAFPCTVTIVPQLLPRNIDSSLWLKQHLNWRAQYFKDLTSKDPTSRSWSSLSPRSSRDWSCSSFSPPWASLQPLAILFTELSVCTKPIHPNQVQALFYSDSPFSLLPKASGLAWPMATRMGPTCTFKGADCNASKGQCNEKNFIIFSCSKWKVCYQHLERKVSQSWSFNAKINFINFSQQKGRPYILHTATGNLTTPNFVDLFAKLVPDLDWPQILVQLWFILDSFVCHRKNCSVDTSDINKSHLVHGSFNYYYNY